jgi:hypothetical protein
MKSLSFSGGLAGALSLVFLQELLKRMSPSAPRLDLLRKEAAERIIKKTGVRNPSEKQLNLLSLAGDITLNTLYFSLAGTRAGKPLSTGALLGFGMAMGAFNMPRLLGLNSNFVKNGSLKRTLMVTGIFLAGGLVAAKLANMLEKYRLNQKKKEPTNSNLLSDIQIWI